MVMMGGVTYTNWLCARPVSQRKELKCISAGSKKKPNHLIFRSDLGMSIAVGKIRTVTTSAGYCGAQSPGTAKVEISRAEGGESAAESPQASASSSVFAGKSKLLLQLPIQRFGARTEIQFLF